jgi:hypothetical protein
MTDLWNISKNLFLAAVLALVAGCATDPNIKVGKIGLFMGNLSKASTTTESQIGKCWIREPTWINGGIAYRRKDQPRSTVFEVRRTTMFSNNASPFLTIRILDGGDPRVPAGGDQVLSIEVIEKEFTPKRVLNLSEDVWRWAAGQRDCQIKGDGGIKL